MSTEQVQGEWIVQSPLKVGFLGVEEFRHLDFSRWFSGPLEIQDMMLNRGRLMFPLSLGDNRPLDFPSDSVWCGFKFTIFSTKSRILLHSHKCRSFYSCFAASLHHLHISHHTQVKDKKGLSENKLVSYTFKIQCVSKCEGLSDIHSSDNCPSAKENRTSLSGNLVFIFCCCPGHLYFYLIFIRM